MKRLLLGVVLLAMVACKPAASAPNPLADPRAIARQVVDDLVLVWKVAADTCLASADPAPCSKILLPAADALHAAAVAVDVWDATAQHSWICAAKTAAEEIATLVTLPPVLKAVVDALPAC